MLTRLFEWAGYAAIIIAILAYGAAILVWVCFRLAQLDDASDTSGD